MVVSMEGVWTVEMSLPPVVEAGVGGWGWEEAVSLESVDWEGGGEEASDFVDEPSVGVRRRRVSGLEDGGLTGGGGMSAGW